MNEPTRYLPVIALAILLSGCGKQNQFVSPPPPQVEVQTPNVGETEVYSEYAGRTSGSARVEIRARVKGFLQKTHFKAGQYVKEGADLFSIEPEEFEAARATAQGKFAKAEADLELAKINAQKLKTAFEKNAVSEIEKLTAEAEVKAAQANLEIAGAELENAERDLRYTNLKAPLSGRISSALVDQGNLVGASDPTLLTSIISVQPIYFDFEVSEREILDYLADMPNATQPNGSNQGIKERKITLLLADGTEFAEKGRFDFGDNAVNPESGTLRARVVFENRDGLLIDGLFARIRIPKKVENVAEIPSVAIQRDLGGSFVLVVNEQDIVERRTVIPTPFSKGAMRIIEAFDESTGTGLKESDRFIVSNLQRAREGIAVKPQETPPPQEESPAKETSSDQVPEKSAEKEMPKD